MKISIYKIYNDEMTYIGSSQNFKDRMKKHKSSCYNKNDNGYNYFIYQYIRQNGGWDQFTKDIIHECEVKDKTEQRMIEQEWINKNECKLNKNKSYQTKEEKKEQQKQYREKLRQKFTCLCGGKYTQQNKAIHERTNKHKKFIAKNNIIPVV
jgi:hypothetical protein